MTLASRMKRALAAGEARGLNQAALARACGVKEPSVSAWFSGDTKSLKGENAVLAARYLGVNAEWLTTGRGPMSSDEPAVAAVADQSAEYVTVPDGDADPDEWVDVAFYPTASAAAGRGAINGEHAPRLQLKFRRVSMRQKGLDASACMVTNVRGESMAPLLADGDQVMVDPSQRAIRDGAIYVCRVDGEAEIVKRLYRRPGGRVLVKSDNPAHPEYEAEIGPGFEVLGRAVWRAGWL